MDRMFWEAIPFLAFTVFALPGITEFPLKHLRMGDSTLQVVPVDKFLTKID